MPRLRYVRYEEANADARVVYDQILSARGWLGNIHRGIANSPPVLDAFWSIHNGLKRSGITLAETEAIRLIVSERYGCEYCLAAHTMIGRRAGLPEAEMLRLRAALPEDPKLRAIKIFVDALLNPEARISEAQLEGVRAAGYDDGQITAMVFAVALTVFTNLFNRVNLTDLDPEIPPVVRIRKKGARAPAEP
jgi:AhpD family alkylhydroperoxidase